MAKYMVKPNEFIELTETTGTIQNVDGVNFVEITNDPTVNTGILLAPNAKFSWNNSPLYVRAASGSLECEVRVLPFEEGGSGGGGGGTIDLKMWNPNTSYTAGEQIVYKQTMYRVTTSFISGSTFSETNLQRVVAGEMVGATSLAGGMRGLVPEPAAGDEGKVLFGDGTWKNAGGADIAPWKANTSYSAGDYLVYRQTVYKVVTAFTSGTTFDDTNLTRYIAGEMVGASGLADGERGLVPQPESGDEGKVLYGDGKWKPVRLVAWVSGGSYEIGDCVTYDERIYECLTANSDAVWTPAKWQKLSGELEDWASGTSYNIGDCVIYSDRIYRCDTANTDVAWTASKWTMLSGELQDWASGTSYKVGDCVIYDKRIYECLTANSDASWTPAKWQKLSGDLLDWVASTDYAVGDCVIYNKRIYKCLTANNDAVWTASKWQALSVELTPWASGTSYSVGDYVVYDNSIYECITANSDVSWTAAKWQLISGSGIASWATSTDYEVGDKVIFNAQIYSCNTAHTSTAWATDVAKWDLIAGLQTWATNTTYKAGSLLYASGILYRVDTTFTSTSTFEDTNLTPVTVLLSEDTDNILQEKADGLFCDDPEELTAAEIQALINGFNPEADGKSLDDWATNTAYAVGDYVIHNGEFYKCITAHTSGTWATDIAKWQLISGVETWAANTLYTAGQVIYHDGTLYYVNSTFTSGATFDTTNLTTTLPVATDLILGGVKSTTVDGGVAVDANGIMSVNDEGYVKHLENQNDAYSSLIKVMKLGLEKGTNPSENMGVNCSVRDKNNANISMIYSLVNQYGSNLFGIYAYDFNGTDNAAAILHYDSDGKKYLAIPTPEQTNNTNKAITGEWFRSNGHWDTAASHNAHYRGKNITSLMDSGDMSTVIANGTFVDIFPGDYVRKSVTINGTTYADVKWVVMDLDYFLHIGDTDLTTHHIVLMPEPPLLGNTPMNDTATAEGGYVGSKMWTTTIPLIDTGIESAFGSAHVLNHREFLSNTINATAVSSGFSGWTGASAVCNWFAAKSNIPNEPMVYGCHPCSSSLFDAGTAPTQFAAFKHNPTLIYSTRKWFWLRAVASSTMFVISDYGGYSSAIEANTSNGRGGVRPYFLYK